MDHLEALELSFRVIQILFAAAFGACAGSLVNVLVYRLPLGLGVVTPPSRCPLCQTRLTWRENIPIFGWILLRGRCRTCRGAISLKYPLVEAFVALLFALFYVLWYVVPSRTGSGDGALWLGVDWSVLRPDWTAAGLAHTWPIFAAVLVLVVCLVAMTLIDAQTCMIPLALTWVPAVAGVLLHTGWAVWVQASGQRTLAGLWGEHRFSEWAIPTPGPAGWVTVGAALGGVVGLGFANVFLAKGWIRRSFADYHEWESRFLAQQSAVSTEPGSADVSAPPPQSAPRLEPDAPDLWIRYPHARREMLKEIVFLAPCLGLAYAGGAIAYKLAGPWSTDLLSYREFPATSVPLWLAVLAGALWGYLIGGGIVWATRIFGSLAFGKEAMGLGDVHLMAAVGACLGWVDAVIAFFLAAFVGLAYAGLSRLGGGALRRTMPYGPFLACATVLLLLGKPLLERLLGLILPSFAPM